MEQAVEQGIFEGGCRCGAIRYQAIGMPEHHALCHCVDCRRSSGAPLVGWALFPEAAVTISGAPVRFESSPGVERHFCGRCGTGLFYRNPAIFPDHVDIQSATLDRPDDLPPQACIQMADAPSWLGAMAALPHFDRYPG